MTVGAPRVSVIISAYQSDATIAACLDALREQTFRNFETIVVNSSKEDRTASLVAHRFPEILFEQSPVRLLPQAARNRGVALARGDVFVFTDPDCVPSRDWLERLVEACNAGHAVVSGSLAPASGDWFQWAVHLSKFAWLLSSGRPGPCRTVCTANAAYTRTAFEAIGPFVDHVSIGDALLSWRAVAAGLAPWFEPRAVIRQWHGHTFAQYVREFYGRGQEFIGVKSQSVRWTRAEAALRAAVFPAIAGLEVARIGRDAFLGREARRWLTTMPVQLVFKLAWSMGEARRCLAWLRT